MSYGILFFKGKALNFICILFMLNSEKTLTNPRLLCKKIEETLKHNTWEKRYMVPSPNLYPYQWNWDSGFVAMGIAHFDLPRAISPKKYMRRSHIIALFWGVVCVVIAFYTRCFLFWWNAIGAVVILLVGYLVSVWLGKSAQDTQLLTLESIKFNQPFVYYLLLFFAVIVVFSVMLPILF